jgi:hypothetical protein
MPVLIYDPKSRGAEAYAALGRELVARTSAPPPVAPAIQ